MSGKPVLFVTSCLFIISCLLIAQQPSPTPAAPQSASNTDTKQPSTQPATMSVTVKVVNVPATVRDKHGKIISTLGKDDFVLEEDGRPQTIRYFAHDTDLPLTLGLLVDTSLSQRRVLEEERHASYSFLDQMLHQARDVAFVIHFDHEVELLQDLTANREKLDSALQTMQTSTNTSQQQTGSQGGNGGGSNGGGSNGGSSNGSGYPGGRGSGRHGGRGFGGGGTLLYDAAYLASDELMKKQQGRKALIILSDGVDHGSKVGLETAIETGRRKFRMTTVSLRQSYLKTTNQMAADSAAWAVEAWVAVATLAAWAVTAVVKGIRRSRGLTARKFWSGLPRKPADSSLKFPKNSPSIRFMRPLRRTFATSTTLVTRQTVRPLDGGYHKIILKTKEKDVTVQARDGYYASHPSE